MKIRAIRLKEVGRFSAPVALEGLSGGLDVLAGPNEFGKSTILKAVKAALFEQHRSKHRKLEAFRPYAGGAPLIEVDFEVGGKPWRIRKQFLSAPAAELRDLQSGSVARGADAEARLSELLGGAEHFALLCVDQGSPLAAMTPINTGGAPLMRAIESEVESVAEGNAARFVAERVNAELAVLVTSHNPPRPTGIYRTALDERDRLLRDRQAAEQRLASAQERLDKLEELRGRLAQLSDADATRARDAAAGEARRLFEEARAAREKCKAAEQVAASCEQRLGALKAALEAFDRRTSDLAKLEVVARDAAPRLTELEAHANVCEARAIECRKARDELKKALATAECDRRALELADRVQQLTARLEAARVAQAERGALGEALAGNAADDTAVGAMRREAAAIAAVEARLSAAAPRVSLAYLPGGAGKIKVDGRALADGEVLNPSRPVTLHIEGIGTLTIAPGQSDDVANDEADLAAHRAQLASLLQRAGATSLPDAERLLAERRETEAKLGEATAQLKASAPEGVERLQRTHAELAAQATALGAASVTSSDDQETRGQELTEALGLAEEKLNEAAREERTAREELVGLRTRIAGHAEQIATLLAELGPPQARNLAREQRLAAATDAQSALNAAVRDGGAWREKAPDDTRFAALKQAAESAELACKRADEELASLRRVEAGLEGELKSDRADDVAARLAELADACAVAEVRCRDMQEEAAALQMLARELDGAATRTRDRFAKPVIERLATYLQLVLPQARLVLGEDLAPQALERAASAEDLARLSDGTQEQLALLVRLAFARLLADNGTPAPLILDDALVYADDGRIMRMFSALQHAAQSHQVLVLTCRERAFEGLSGHRIALRTWEDARAAA
jgi:energy-coupling factor transporter ATP-binding protein EcfA2